MNSTERLFVLQCSDGGSAQDNSSLKRVAVVEDFFDIIYAMHVEMGADPGRAPKHAGQKKTYKAVSKISQVGVLLIHVDGVGVNANVLDPSSRRWLQVQHEKQQTRVNNMQTLRKGRRTWS